DFADWFYAPSWKRSPCRVTRTDAAAGRGVCLVFADPASSARAADRVRLVGYDPVVVEPGDGYASLGDDRYVVAPASRADYIALVNDLVGARRPPAAVIHLWNLPRAAARDHAATRRYQDRGFYSLMYLAQALGEVGVATPLRMVVATEGVHEVTGAESLLPEKAVVAGPCRVIPQEFPNIACRQVDLESAADLTEADADRLAREVVDDGPDSLVAYRAGRRWVRTFEPLPLAAGDGAVPPRLRQEGVYLITGGLGGVGLVLAGYLARAVHARLILTGRKGLPPREQWDSYVASRGSEDATSRKIAAVQSLEAAGAEVIVGSADVVDEAAMRAVVEDAYARFGRLDGVIHAAGIAGGGMIQLKTPEIADPVLAPKVTGSQVLERVLAGRPLDFFVLCSSLTGVLGGVGQIDYTAANAYLDAFAHHYAAKTGTPTIAVNWNAWREVGMAVDTDIHESLRESLRGRMLAVGISNAEGIDAFRRILTHVAERQVSLSPIDVQVLLDLESIGEEETAAADEAVSTDAASAGARKAHARPNLPTPFVAPESDAEQKMCAIWADALGIDRVGTRDNFFDLGGHSLLAVQVMARVNRALGAAIPVAKLYEGLTVAFLAGLLKPAAAIEQTGDDDADLVEKRREKSRRQKEHQMRRRVALGR